jgi:predicted O-methyltransferase YrrM
MSKTWQDVPGWFDFQDIYSEAVASASPAAHFVELGVAFGKSTIYMATEIARSGKAITFDAVDSWDTKHLAKRPHDLQEVERRHGGMRQAFEWFASECGVEKFINQVPQDMVEAAKNYRPQSLDFIFLDACHIEESTKGAINAWLPKVVPGGVFAGHDFTPAWPGVVAAVNALLPAAVKRGNCFFWRVPA